MIRGLSYNDLPAEVGDGEMVLICESYEYAEDADRLVEFAERMRASGRKVGYMPHREANGSITHRARLFVGPLPDCIFDFVGPTRDLSKASGFLAYRGMLAENCYTAQQAQPWQALLDTVKEHLAKTDAPPHLFLNEALIHQEMGEHQEAAEAAQRYLQTNDWGDARAMALTILAETAYRNIKNMEFSYYAQATLVTPLPKAFLGMARTGAHVDFMDRVDQAWAAADRRMDFWPWSSADRFNNPGYSALQIAVDKGDVSRARRYLARLLEHGEDVKVSLPVVQPLIVRVDGSEGLQESVAQALLGRGHRVIVAGAFDVQLVFTLDALGYAPNVSADLCPQVPLDSSIETIHKVMRARKILVLSEFQRDQLKTTLPFVPDRQIKRVSLGYNAVPVGEKEPLIVVGTGSDMGVAKDIFDRVASEVHVSMMMMDAQLSGTTVGRAKIWLYTGTDERMPLVPTELLEAQSAGAVPVCVGTGAIPEYVIRGYFYKPPATAEAFKVAAARRIIELLLDEGERLSVATAHQRELNELRWDEVIDEWVK